MAKAHFEITATNATAQAFASVDRSLQNLVDKADTVKAAFEGFIAVEGLEHIVEVTAESEKAQALLASQVKATGEAAHLSAQQLTEIAESLQGTTIYSHEQIEQVEAEMLAFTHITGEQFQKTLQVVLDFSTVTGRDASEAVRTLGEAINNPIASMGRLSQAGISLDSVTKQQIESLQEHGHLVEAQNVLLGKLEESYSGAATAARDTLGGALQGLKNDFNDLLEGNGGGVAGVTDSINELDATLRDPAVKSGIQSLVSGLLDLVGVAAKLGEAFSNLGTNIGEFFAKMQGYTGNFDDQINTLNGRIAQTKEAIENLKAGEGESEEVKQLEAQLLRYQNQLIQVQQQQKELTGKYSSAAGAPGGTSPGGAPAAAPAHDQAFNDLVYGKGQTKDTYKAPLQKTEIPELKPPEGLKPIEMSVHFDSVKAAAEMKKLSTEVGKTGSDMITAAFNQKEDMWKGIFAPIDSAFSETISGVIRGTETWHQGMKKIFSSIEQEFIGLGVKMVTDWAAKELAKLAVSEETGAAQVATATSTAATTLAVTTAADEKSILSDAWTAAAKVYKSVADIPFVGWIMAPALAIAAAAEVAGFARRIASAEGGWWQVPGDQMAQIHKDEMVLPRHLAEPLRQNIESGNAGGGHNIHIHANDSKSFGDMLKRNPRLIREAIEKAKRSHSLA